MESDDDEPDIRFIGYARVSTDEQNLDLQLDALRKAGCKDEDICFEKVSAASAKRPKLKEAIFFLHPGDTFVVWKLDRVARSLSDLLNKLEQIEEAGAGFMSLTENIDTTTPAGRFMMQIMGAMAEFERNIIRERTKAGMAAARARGVKPGREQLLSAAEVKHAQKLRKQGYSPKEICEHFGVSRTTINNYTVPATAAELKRAKGKKLPALGKAKAKRIAKKKPAKKPKR